VHNTLTSGFQEEEEEEEEELPVPTGPAIQQQQVDSSLNTPKPHPNRPNVISKPGSRATSPSNLPGLGGHTMVAKRATSPKVPKPKPVGSASGGNSPLGSRANSPVAGSRATSPAWLDSINGSQKKRKADDSLNSTVASPNAAQPPKPKKRKGHPAGPVPVAVSPAELEMMLVEWLKNTPNATTRDCIQHFTPYLTDGDKKTGFSAMVRKVAQLKGGVLALRTIVT
jgi:transcription initiation factor TFIIF subunit alpha